MSKAILGETFDIHGGGLDLLFPHHENELAQSQCCHGKPMVTYWMHNGLLSKAASSGKIGGKSDRSVEANDGGKVSRSKGAGGLADDIARHGGERIRFFLLSTHYRSTVVFGEEGLAETAKSLEGFYRFFERFQKITRQRFYNLPYAKTRREGDAAIASQPLLETLAKHRQNFLEKMDDDFNTGGAVAELFDMLRELNKFADQKNLDRFTDLQIEDLKSIFADSDVQTIVQGARILRELAAILGIFKTVQPKRGGGGDGVVEKLMPLLIELRANARANKDFATGDLIRNKLAESGITLEDKKGGPTEWRIGGAS
jgi:cysteinyl-tRNA synthetase